MPGFPASLRALAHRNYRLFMAGQCVSFVGTWMQQTALAWLVYRMTESSFLLGLVAFCGQIPAFFLAPIAGVLGDRMDRRRTLFVTQGVAAVQAVLLVVLMASGEIQVWQIIALSVVLGLSNAFDMPNRQAFLVDMVPARGDLANAVALNSTMVNLSRLIGPVVAGAVIAVWGVTTCFVMNAVSYIPVFYALAAMRDLPLHPRPAPSPVRKGLAEGFAYAFGFAPIRTLLLIVGMLSLLGMPVITLLPVFAKDILHGDAKLFGYLASASGAGSLTAALYLARRRTIVGLGNAIAASAAAFGGGMIAFSLSASVPLSLGILTVTGFSMMLLLASSNTLLQTIVDDDKRGRVMSIYTMAFMGTAPFGSLLAGSLAAQVGAQRAAQLCGGLCILGAAAFASRVAAIRAQVLPIYERAGLVPPVTAAVQAATQLTAAPEEQA
jgi:MFS family permease